MEYILNYQNAISDVLHALLYQQTV